MEIGLFPPWEQVDPTYSRAGPAELIVRERLDASTSARDGADKGRPATSPVCCICGTPSNGTTRMSYGHGRKYVSAAFTGETYLQAGCRSIHRVRNGAETGVEAQPAETIDTAKRIGVFIKASRARYVELEILKKFKGVLKMSRLDSMIRTACTAAFTAVALSALAPLALAADILPAGAFAVVNGVALPQSQLDTAVGDLAARTGQAETPQLRMAIRQDLIVRELLRQAAEKGNYRVRPDVKQAIDALTVDVETQAYVKDNVHPQPVTDEQVKASYDELVASLGKNEYKPRIITVSDAATAQKVMAALQSGQAFDALARQYSLAPTRAVGGEMPWVSYPVPVSAGHTQGLPVELAQAIANLPAGGITRQPVQVGNVWAIVKLDAKRVTQIPGFDQEKARIRGQLQALAVQKAGADLSVSLLRGATVQQ